ncbi:SusC/RagA family TonB-linked outer membrane protein [Parapedobacter tibetensis]|uniref:SusC/RagA family TonB-linked outer membrane protein n=1 Tax=Parapedobacter tibetensis TaxID=2972951 RepID=UPI00214DA515|nr:SusC/RagA family TonB-linked outer membrane protein [Parapedobacter tibetensis]
MKRLLRLVAMLWPILTTMCLEARTQAERSEVPTKVGSSTQRSPVLSGIVTDTSDNPLIGVTVAVLGTMAKTQTDDRGRFTVKSPSIEGTLVISFLGYKAIRQPFGKGNIGAFNLVMRVDPTMLETVEVSTGYQHMARERSTGSFEVVGNKLLNRKISTDIISRLEDVVSGLATEKITRNADRGAMNRGRILNVGIRGESTMRANKWPLVVVDGFPYRGDINNINPNDIADVTVLKDAAAASIWGASSANGVIVIKTKRASINRPPAVEFTANFTIADKPDLFYLPQINTGDFIDVERFLYGRGFYESRFNGIYSGINPVPLLLRQQEKGMLTSAELESEILRLRGVDMRDDFLEYIYRPSSKQQYHVSASGGNENFKLMGSLGYDGNRNEVVTSTYEKYNIRLASDFGIGARLRVNMGLYFTSNEYHDTGNESQVEYHRMGFGLGNYPYMEFADERGNPLAVNVVGFNPVFRDTVAGGRLLDWQYRPLAELGASYNLNRTNEVMATLGADYRLAEGLTAHMAYSYQTSGGEVRNLESLESFNQRYLINYYTEWDANNLKHNIPVGDRMDLTNYNHHAHNGRGQLSYRKNWNGTGQLDGLAGVEIRETGQRHTNRRIYGYNGDLLAYTPVDGINRVKVLNGLDGTALIPDGTALGDILQRFVSTYVNLGYDMYNRYTVTASARTDASNLFGVNTNDKWQPFWSVGFGWKISNEPFFRTTWIQYLRARGTFGYNGNVNNGISAYPTIAYSPSPHPVSGLGYASVRNPPNPDLSWEKVGMANFALEFQTINSRVHGTIEYYRKWPTGLLMANRLDPTLGFTSHTVNSASLNVNGVDVNLHGNIINRSKWDWSADVTYGFNRSKVKESYLSSESGANFVGGVSGVLMTPVEGKDLYGLYAYKWGGLDPETGDPIGYLDGEPSKDYIALYNPRLADLEYHGPTKPVHFGSVRNTLRYGNIEVSANVIFHLGHYFANAGLNYTNLFNSGLGNAQFASRWRQPGDEQHTDVPSMVYPANIFRDRFYEFSSALVERADYVKLRDVTFSYTLPANSIPMFEQCRIHCYASNFGVLWKANKSGIDPEFGRSMPAPLTIALGVNCKL